MNYQLCFIVMQCELKVKLIKVYLTGNALICIISFNENVIFVYVIYIRFIDVIFKRLYYVSFLGNNVYCKIIYFYIFIIWISLNKLRKHSFFSVFVIFDNVPVFNTSHIQYIESLNPKVFVCVSGIHQVISIHCNLHRVSDPSFLYKRNIELHLK